jgi:hypothetical protein
MIINTFYDERGLRNTSSSVSAGGVTAELICHDAGLDRE